jgi:hypothetical protein
VRFQIAAPQVKKYSWPLESEKIDDDFRKRIVPLILVIACRPSPTSVLEPVGYE